MADYFLIPWEVRTDIFIVLKKLW